MFEKDCRNGLQGALVILSLVIIAAAMAYAAWGPARAVVAEPGSPEDPLISKSYFERYVRLDVVELPAGARLVAEAGTELILRSGRATAIGSQLGGLSDVTGGKDLQTGQTIPQNHLLIVPRSDGRGVLATTPCIIMVRGPRTVTGP